MKAEEHVNTQKKLYQLYLSATEEKQKKQALNAMRKAEEDFLQNKTLSQKTDFKFEDTVYQVETKPQSIDQFSVRKVTTENFYDLFTVTSLDDDSGDLTFKQIMEDNPQVFQELCDRINEILMADLGKLIANNEGFDKFDDGEFMGFRVNKELSLASQANNIVTRAENYQQFFNIDKQEVQEIQQNQEQGASLAI